MTNRSALAGALALCVLAVAAFCQTTTSTLEGLVQDVQGALIPHAEVVVTNAATGQTYKTTTDEHGHWVFASMPTATYRVTASAQGFRGRGCLCRTDGGDEL